MKTALLIIDLQEGNRSHIHKVDSVIQATQRTLEKARQQSIPVLYYRFVGGEKDTKRFGSNTWTPQNTPEFELFHEISPLTENFVLDKTEYSAFSTPETETLLKKLNVTKIWLCGCMSQVCVLATSLDAYERNYEVLAIQDAIGATSEANLEMGLTWMRKYTSTLTLSENL
jgi:nicotinamidase-related amidase